MSGKEFAHKYLGRRISWCVDKSYQYESLVIGYFNHPDREENIILDLIDPEYKLSLYPANKTSEFIRTHKDKNPILLKQPTKRIGWISLSSIAKLHEATVQSSSSIISRPMAPWAL